MATKKTPEGGKPTRGPGRPTIYTPELATEICRRLAAGQSLRKACEDPELPAKGTVLRWLTDPSIPVEFRDQYAQARAEQADLFAEEIVEIADGEDRVDAEGRLIEDAVAVQRDKLRVDARKWAASKIAPKKYGHKMEISTGASLEDALRQIAEKRGLARGD